ncbi:hypothetical protein BG015_003105 [Linnemannia schmuckeri]|uniref:Uncharacterized protein n=1 Tax=Linnemannia schmuckeri TaxID=64567 RepID=A0A9P5VDG2_9FUNG|nr:hypothetical protein BG015_003105 [Linnemannia schmuckeri]
MGQYSSHDNNEGDEVTILVSARGSSGDIVRAVTLGTITNPEDGSLESNVYLSMPYYEVDRVLRRGCVNTNVAIMFPSNTTHFESLKIQNRNKDNVEVRLGASIYGDDQYPQDQDNGIYLGRPAPAGPKLTMDRLDVKTNHRRVWFTNAFVKEDLKVVAAQGSIFG